MAEFQPLALLRFRERKVWVGVGDLTEQAVDAIVNAANEFLQHGGGIAGAILRKGGPEIQRESDAWGYVPVGNAAATTAGRLPARWVIHAVGPRGGEPQADEKLRWAVWSALREAERLMCRSVALPPISTGIFGFPKDRGCQVILRTVLDFLAREARSLQEVRLLDLNLDGARFFVQAIPRVATPDVVVEYPDRTSEASTGPA